MTLTAHFNMKKCKKCFAFKAIEYFCKDSKMADGHLNICKECKRSDVNKYRMNNIEKVRDYDRKRGNRQSKQYFTEYYKKNKDKVLNSKKKWTLKNQIKKKAHSKVLLAIKKGLLIKPNACELCRVNNLSIHAHHDDYTKPLDVKWLCVKCHALRHRVINEANRISFNRLKTGVQ